MNDLFNTLADLLDERDRESLEVTLARVAFELTGARRLDMWRVFDRQDGFWLRRRVALPTAVPADEDIPLAQAPASLLQAWNQKSVVTIHDAERNVVVYAMPVAGGSDVLGIIEIEAQAAIEREKLVMLSGMLRIYRSHLAALDYGDTDELTGLANRRTFDEQFRRFALAEERRSEARRAADHWTARAFIGVADIDNFKRINDRFGHPYGDEVLVLFAGLMRRNFRESDRLFRFGGEEFVILLSNCGLDDALLAFERFRAAVEGHSFPQVGQVTVSLGVTSLHAHDTGSSAFGRADQALYVAKRSGRNRVLLHDNLPQSATVSKEGEALADVEFF